MTIIFEGTLGYCFEVLYVDEMTETSNAEMDRDTISDTSEDVQQYRRKQRVCDDN